MPWGGCVSACVSFFLVCCARGDCKRSETEIARIYLLLGHREKRKGKGNRKGKRNVRTREKKGNGKSKEFAFSLWFAVVGALARGDGKVLESEIARIYVPTSKCVGQL